MWLRPRRRRGNDRKSRSVRVCGGDVVWGRYEMSIREAEEARAKADAEAKAREEEYEARLQEMQSQKDDSSAVVW